MHIGIRQKCPLKQPGVKTQPSQVDEFNYCITNIGGKSAYHLEYKGKTR